MTQHPASSPWGHPDRRPLPSSLQGLSPTGRVARSHAALR
jgi:hypothetical protein